MRIVAFERNGQPAFGVREREVVHLHPGAPSAVALAANPGDFPADGSAAFADLVLLPPVPRPGKILCVGLNYRDHATESGEDIPDYPAVFMRAATSLTPSGDAITLPRASDRLDYEAELAVVIGRRGRHIASARALDHVAGYACFNDGSIRDYQRRTSQWTMGKNFDRTGGFGPELVTPDELPAGAHGLRIRSLLNGCVMQDGDTSDMIFDVERLIVLLSEVMTLEPGDVIATGTPAGVGMARKPPVFLRADDQIDVAIEGVGTLTNKIEHEAKPG